MQETEYFKFEPSQLHASIKSMTIPIVLGGDPREVEVSTVDAKIPFLLGRDYLNKWNLWLKSRNNSLIANKEKKVKLESNSKGQFPSN